MNFKKLGLLFVLTAVGFGFFYAYFIEGQQPDSLEQTSLEPDSGSQIQLPPENTFYKKNPTRDVQSEKESSLKSRNPSQVSRKLKPVALFNMADLKLEKHEVLGGTSWQLWQGVKVEPPSVDSGEVLGKVSNFNLVASDDVSELDQFLPSKPVAVFDTRRKKPGIITGTFAVQLRPEANPEILTQDPAIKVLQSFPEIHTYFVTSVQTPFDLLKFKQSLLERGAVLDVQTEILSRNYEKF